MDESRSVTHISLFTNTTNRYRKDSTILDKGSESLNEMYFLEFYNNPLKQDVRYEAHYYCAILFDDITIWQVSIYTFLSG